MVRIGNIISTPHHTVINGGASGTKPRPDSAPVVALLMSPSGAGVNAVYKRKHIIYDSLREGVRNGGVMLSAKRWVRVELTMGLEPVYLEDIYIGLGRFQEDLQMNVSVLSNGADADRHEASWKAERLAHSNVPGKEYAVFGHSNPDNLVLVGSEAQSVLGIMPYEKVTLDISSPSENVMWLQCPQEYRYVVID